MVIGDGFRDSFADDPLDLALARQVIELIKEVMQAIECGYGKRGCSEAAKRPQSFAQRREVNR